MVIPIADRHNEAAGELAGVLRARGLRVEVDDSSNRMQNKIRLAQEQKVPVHARARRPRGRGAHGVAPDAGPASSSRPRAGRTLADRLAAEARPSGGRLTDGHRTARAIVPGDQPVAAVARCSLHAERITSNIEGATISRDLRVNQMIRIPQVRVVDEEGAQLGVMPTPQALAMAQERGYDLVEVAPMARPPVVRFLDFGQYKYELTKREKEAKRKQRSVTFKEVRLKPKIGIG